MIKTYITGAATANFPLLIVHGLFGSAHNWSVIARRMSDERQVITVDMRNHGESAWKQTHSYADQAGDLAEVIAAHGARADVVGHSMGGKAAMMLALLHPGAVNRLIVADIAPVAYGHSQTHLIDAMRAIDLSRVERRSDAERQLAQSVDDAGTRAFLLQSLDIKAKRWRLNLDTLAAEMDKITGWPEIEAQFGGPVLFLSGGRSDYVKPEYRPAIRALFPNAKFAKIPGVAHWLHAEKPREFEAAMRAFLDVRPASRGRGLVARG